MRYIKVERQSETPSSDGPNALCPHCSKIVNFDRTPVHDLKNSSKDSNSRNLWGIRRCPNPSCHGLVFVMFDFVEKTFELEPPALLPFEKDNIPPKIAQAFSEAITCHAHSAFVASAIMVRKTLEEICHHKYAKGNNLKERLDELGKTIVIPRDLVDTFHDLRLLGNDAAHIESQEYNQVSKDEVEAGIAIATEILRATYQYEGLKNKLAALKKAKPAIAGAAPK